MEELVLHFFPFNLLTKSSFAEGLAIRGFCLARISLFQFCTYKIINIKNGKQDMKKKQSYLWFSIILTCRHHSFCVEGQLDLLINSFLPVCLTVFNSSYQMYTVDFSLPKHKMVAFKNLRKQFVKIP